MNGGLRLNDDRLTYALLHARVGTPGPEGS